MKSAFALIILLLAANVSAQEQECIYIISGEEGNVPVRILDRGESPLGIGLMTMIISMSILAGWWVKTSFAKILNERMSGRKKAKPRKPSLP